MNELEFRDASYFNEVDTYVFLSPLVGEFMSGVNFERGRWWTNEGLQYESTSIKCYNLTKANND